MTDSPTLKPGDKVVVLGTLNEERAYGTHPTDVTVTTTMKAVEGREFPLNIQVTRSMVKPDPTPILREILLYCSPDPKDAITDETRMRAATAWRRGMAWLEGR